MGRERVDREEKTVEVKDAEDSTMDKRHHKRLSPCQRKSVAVRILLLLLCVFILFGGYILQNEERNRKSPEEDIQNKPTTVETYEKENLDIQNEYQTKFQDEVNSYEIKDGKLYGSGENSNGQLGTGEITSKDSYEQQILIAENVVHMDACGGTLVYLNDKNELYGVGSNQSGQLGQPLEEQEGRTYIAYNVYNECCVIEPVFIMDHVKYAAVGGGYIMVLQEDGSLYTMGGNLNGQLGNGTARPVHSEWYAEEGTVYSSEPVYVMDDVAFIAADYCTAAVISKKGDLWVWGDNSFGEIGNGRPSVSTDVVSELYLVLKKIKEVWFKDYTVYAVDFQDQEYSWGKNAAASPKPVGENLTK